MGKAWDGHLLSIILHGQRDKITGLVNTMLFFMSAIPGLALHCQCKSLRLSRFLPLTILNER